jgi:hypothetical protein
LRGCAAALGAAAVVPLLNEGEARAATAGPDPGQLFRAGRLAAADRGYARLLAADPGDAHAWAQRGYLALLSNRFGDSERFLSAAIKLAPGDTVSMSRLADCYVRRGDFARAVPPKGRTSCPSPVPGASTGTPPRPTSRSVTITCAVSTALCHVRSGPVTPGVSLALLPPAALATVSRQNLLNDPNGPWLRPKDRAD